MMSYNSSMDTQTLLQEQMKEFDKKFVSLFDGEACEDSSCTHYHAEEAIKQWHKESIKQILQAEIKRLEKTKVTDKKGFVEFFFGDGKKETIRCHTNMASGFNMAIDDQIDRLTHIIEML